MTTRDPFWRILGAAVVLVLLLGLMGGFDREAEADQAEVYCMMVHAHQLNKREGWPDYLGTYATQCRNGRVR